MSFKFKRALCLLISAAVAFSAFSLNVYAEGENADISEAAETTEDTAPQTDPLESEDWLAVATEVITYYSELSAGMEPLVTEKNWRFYDVIPDKVINIDDASFFLNLYAVCGSGISYEGYIPVRNGEYSTLVTTVPAETTTTSAVITTIPASETTSVPETETTFSETVTTTTVPVTEETTTSSSTTAATENKTTSSVKTTTSKTETSGKTTTTGKTTTVKTTTGKNSTTASMSVTGKTTASGKTTTGKTATSTASGITSAGPTQPASTETTVTTSTDITTTTTVITRTPLTYGIDVSVYQGIIDWEEVKESGVEFAVIRAGYGRHISQEDKYFDMNMENAQAAGIDCGAYWFSYATTPEAAELEADVFYEVIKEYKFEYPVFFDYETSAQFQLTPEESTAIIEAFCKRMESYGYYVSLCSYVNFLNTRIEPEVFDTYDAWIAHYNVQVPRFEYSHGMWQYSCSGTVPGINADVDLNYAYYDYPQIMKDMKLNGFE